MANVGYVGLGEMGSVMVKRLLAAGHTVTGYNRTRSKADPLIELGMTWADSPREVTEGADLICSMVTSTNAVQAITQGPDGILAALTPNKIYIDMTTMSPKYSQELAEQVMATTGAKMLDAPVSGSTITLNQGKATFMVGGDEAAFDIAKPVLEDIGPNVFHVGENGKAVALKIAINLSLAVQMMSFSEGVLLAEKSGIPREKVVEVILSSVIASPMVAYRGPFVLGQPDEVLFNCTMMQKDMNLAIELGQELDVPLPTTATTNEYLSAARGMGLGHYDFSIIFDVLARMSGVETDH